MSEADQTRWDARYRGQAAPHHPAAHWLDTFEARLPRQGRGLDVAAGTGAFAVWMARRGLDALAVDVSPAGLALASAAAQAAGVRVHTLAVDLEREPPPSGPFALIGCFHYRQPTLWPVLWRRLSPGGVLLAETATVTNLERHARPSRRWLVERGQLGRELRALAGAELLWETEGWFDGRHLARVAVRRA